ncbi:MAG: arginine--tRNA ligase [Candidatus Omnitrophica bacterium]|nr:arginine--tRNA ligase [Candidatus Omnitrophota bacterium]
MENKLRKIIADAVNDLAKDWDKPVQDLAYDILVSRDPAHGDFAVNAAFKIAKQVGKPPKVIAEDLLKWIESRRSKLKDASFISRIEVAGAGFLNFYVQQTAITDILRDVLDQDEHYGTSDFGKGKKTAVEFVSANPTGPLTIAHGRQAAIGDCLVRILRFTGHDVTAEYYLNDAGRQMRLLGESVYVRYLENFEMEAVFPEEGYKGAYIHDIAKALVASRKDELLTLDKADAIAEAREFAGKSMMELIEKDLEAIGVRFDSYFSESTLYTRNLVEAALDALRERGHLFDQDGALWFRSTTFGDDKDRVVKKSTGDYTYLAPDIAYHRSKFERGFNQIINLWGPDHHSYVTRLKAACRALGYEQETIDVLIVQLTTLYRDGAPVRMSTRAGEFVTLEELRSEVGPDATRFFFIMRRVSTPLDFDLDLAKKKSDENPVYYLQYAYARIASIIRFSGRSVPEKGNLELLAAPEELDLIKVISEFPKALISASQIFEPYRLADYLRDLAAAFHKFYAHHRVVSENEALTGARLILVEAARITLRNGLKLLGISQPESM